jgi:hypothetical protein
VYQAWAQRERVYQQAAASIITFGRNAGEPLEKHGRREARWLLDHLLPDEEIVSLLEFDEVVLRAINEALHREGFADTETVFEMTPDGGGFRMNTRLCTFVNLPELFNLWYRVTFARSTEQLALPTPRLVTGKPIPVAIPPSPRLRALVASFVQWVEVIKTGQIDPSVDNMLRVVNDGRKAALDVRLVAGGDADPVTKIGVVCDHVAALHQRYVAARATQILFCELGTPSRQSPGRFNVYVEIQAQLTARGIAQEEIACIWRTSWRSIPIWWRWTLKRSASA